MSLNQVPGQRLGWGQGKDWAGASAGGLGREGAGASTGTGQRLGRGLSLGRVRYYVEIEPDFMAGSETKPWSWQGRGRDLSLGQHGPELGL